jgi:DNA helicase IV
MPSFQFRLPSRLELTTIQKLAIDDDNSIFTTGVPGSGKTVVAIYRVARLNNDSKLFTYTRMLTVAINGSVNTHLKAASNKVTSIYDWFARNCQVRLGDIINSDETILNVLHENGISFEELIFDEAQDLPVSLYRSLTAVCNRISIGADDAQRVFSQGTNEEELNEIFVDLTRHELDVNHRNTYDIFDFARHFVPENERAQNPNMLGFLELERRGDKPTILLYNQRPDIINTLRQIINDNIGSNIGVLLIHSTDVQAYYNLIRTEITTECSYYYNRMPLADRTEVESDLKSILITTFKSAKGMEFDIVIVPEMQIINNDYITQFFVGCTRARANLFLFCQGNLPQILRNPDFDETYFLQDLRTLITPVYNDHDDLPF